MNSERQFVLLNIVIVVISYIYYLLYWCIRSSRGSVVKVTDLCPASLDSAPTGTVWVIGGSRKGVWLKLFPCTSSLKALSPWTKESTTINCYTYESLMANFFTLLQSTTKQGEFTYPVIEVKQEDLEDVKVQHADEYENEYSQCIDVVT